ncbi:Ger(x)C family spore germination C-terminal domain-containing protein [Eubacterium multiforme]|uniref:Ger(X)C family germination protein n=1 Tax=Eubacterium multiforme TaxID=83339 RepID=A0ABT9UUU1_9FIRM|nr:Ger(x)C family spore germination C-terminal domain-containing protein [Eubacterium multiforme]MDQ0150094.1 Ger(x)C family germination protein [Eubacterium multiforme]
MTWKTLRRYIILSIIILCVAGISKLYKHFHFSNIEDIDFVAGIGFDVDTSMDKKIFSIPVLVYDFSSPGKITSHILEAKGSTSTESRIDRQFHSGRKFSLGSEKIYLFSKKLSKDGINPSLDGLLNNTQTNGSAIVVTTSNDPKDVLEITVPGYSTAPDYIEGLVNSLQSYSHFSNVQTLYNTYIENSTEGCKFITPNIDIINNKLYLTSMSVFDKGKFVASIPKEQFRSLNVLRNNFGTGIATFLENDNSYISFNTISKRKVECTKNKDGTFNFDINLKVSGQILNNNSSNRLIISPYEQTQLESKINNYFKKNLSEFISTMKTDYKMDLLNLGYIAATKYGRHKVTNWDEEVLKSSINVNVDFNINKFGIGNLSLY